MMSCYVIERPVMAFFFFYKKRPKKIYDFLNIKKQKRQSFSSDEKINSIQEKKISRYIMQISLLYNVEHLDHRPLVKAVHAVAVGGHLEDAVDVVVGDDLAVVVAEVAHEPE